MALQNHFSIFTCVCAFLFSLLASCSLSSISPQPSVSEKGFSQGLGTWYGDPIGPGSTGGACGWADAVGSPPFSAMIAAGNSRIFLQGKGCGHCYQIKCTRAPYCSGQPITVTIADECPGCNNAPYHFDLSGSAFGAMANPGQANNLRNLGQVDIEFQRVWCNYGATKIAFKIDQGTSPSWFAAAIEYVDGDGGLWSVEIAHDDTQNFVQMNNTWGAVWAANVDPSFHGPYSFRLKSSTNNVVIATDAVPSSFLAGHTYYSNVNF